MTRPTCETCGRTLPLRTQPLAPPRPLTIDEATLALRPSAARRPLPLACPTCGLSRPMTLAQAWRAMRRKR